MDNEPKEIYLVLEDAEFEPDFKKHLNVSWCEDQINDTDVKYINSAEVERIRKEAFDAGLFRGYYMKQRSEDESVDKFWARMKEYQYHLWLKSKEDVCFS